MGATPSSGYVSVAYTSFWAGVLVGTWFRGRSWGWVHVNQRAKKIYLRNRSGECVAPRDSTPKIVPHTPAL